MMFAAKFVFQQWLTGLTVTLLIVQPGLMAGWSSPTLVKLKSKESPISLSSQEESWVASLVNAGRLLGAILGPILASTQGSKATISITLWPILLGWLLLLPANSVTWLYVSRILLGCGMGMAFSIFPLFIGEVSISKIRGALISLATVGLPTGQLIASICGTYLSVSMAAAIYVVLVLLLIIVFFWFPDSPHHLLKVGDKTRARAAIHWYRAGEEVDQELEAVEKFVIGNERTSFADKMKKFKTSVVKKATLHVVVLFTFMQICGLNSVLFYMERILISAKFTLIKPSLVVIFVNLWGIIAAVISIVVIDRCGRKFLLFVSSGGVTISMLALSGHFFLIGVDKARPEFEWVPMAAMFLFAIAFYTGLFSVPSAILSEIFPDDIKTIAASVAGVVGAIMAFLSAKTFQPMVDSVGKAYVFFVYAIFASLVIPYTFFAVPETKGKSLQQIQDKLVMKKQNSTKTTL